MSTTTTRKARPAGSISDQLRAIIAGRDLTSYRIASDSGVDIAAVSRFVNHKRGLTLDSLDRIADALGLRLIETARRGKAGRAAKKERDGREAPRAATSADAEEGGEQEG